MFTSTSLPWQGFVFHFDRTSIQLCFINQIHSFESILSAFGGKLFNWISEGNVKKVFDLSSRSTCFVRVLISGRLLWTAWSAQGRKEKNIKAYYLILSEHRRRKNFQDDKLSIEMWQRRIPARVAFDFLYNFKWAVDVNWYEEVNRWYWFQWNSIIEIDRKEESFWHLFNNFRSNDPFQLKASGWK